MPKFWLTFAIYFCSVLCFFVVYLCFCLCVFGMCVWQFCAGASPHPCMSVCLLHFLTDSVYILSAAILGACMWLLCIVFPLCVFFLFLLMCFFCMYVLQFCVGASHHPCLSGVFIMCCCACCHAWCRQFGSPLQFIFVERWIVAQHLLHITPIPRCRVQTGLLLFSKRRVLWKKGRVLFKTCVFFIMMHMLMLVGYSVAFAVFVFAIGCCMWSCFGFLGCILLWF